MQPSSFRTLVLAAAAALAVAHAVPAIACDKGACGRAAAVAATRPGAHPNAVNRVRAKAKRAVPTAPVMSAGAVAVIDPESGMLVPATPEQIGALSRAVQAGAASPLSSRPDAVEVVRLADGTLMATVPASLMMHAFAHRDANGKVTFTCADEHAAAPATAAVPAAAPAKWEDR